MGPSSHWPLAMTAVSLEISEVDPSFYILLELDRDIFSLQVHLSDPPATSPHCHPIQQTPDS